MSNNKNTKATKKSALKTKFRGVKEGNKPDNVLSIWSILESEEFEAEYKRKRREFTKAYENAKRAGVNIQRTPLAVCLFEDFWLDPDGMVVEFLRIAGKTSALPRAKRAAIVQFISPVIQKVAKDLTMKSLGDK